MNTPLVIECGDHSFAPYAFLCCHLIDNPRQGWFPMDVDDGREVEHDWLCEQCATAFALGDELEDEIIPICINCVRHLRGEE